MNEGHADANSHRHGTRLLNGAKLLLEVIAGAQFINGEKAEKCAA